MGHRFPVDMRNVFCYCWVTKVVSCEGRKYPKVTLKKQREDNRIVLQFGIGDKAARKVMRTGMRLNLLRHLFNLGTNRVKNPLFLSGEFISFPH